MDTLKLGLDRRLVDHRPYFADLFAAKFVEDILAERNSSAANIEAEEHSLRRAIELQPARDMRRIGHQHRNLCATCRDNLITRLTDRYGSRHHQRTVRASANPAC